MSTLYSSVTLISDNFRDRFTQFTRYKAADSLIKLQSKPSNQRDSLIRDSCHLMCASAVSRVLLLRGSQASWQRAV